MNEASERNRILDAILAERRTVRTFTDEMPHGADVEAVIAAGLQAPYAELAVGDRSDYRRFVAIRRGGRILPIAGDLMRRRLMLQANQIRQRVQAQPGGSDRLEHFAGRLEALVRDGIPGVGDAPYFVVVAERRGLPSAEQQALAHCLQNMWLKATALGLAFHLVSAVAAMSDDEAFCELLGIPFKEFELNGCALGYAKSLPPPRRRPTVDETTTWLE